MSYKIAVASSDGIQINETFGSAKSFIIYEVTDGICERLEEREYHQDDIDGDGVSLLGEDTPSGGCGSNIYGSENGCGSGSGCGSHGGGCGGPGASSAKVELISDCRCIVCKKIGFQIQKQLERKAISAFDVSCTVEEALKKISFYYKRMDNHETLRGEKY